MTPHHLPPGAQLSEQDQRTIYSNRWFGSLLPEQQKALLDASCRVSLKEGQVFTAQGQSLRKRRDGFGVVLFGLLKISSTSHDGREAILGFIRPGQWMGELSLLDGMNRERDLMSVGATELLVIEPEVMQSLLQDPLLAAQITRLLASRTRTLLSLVEGFTLHNSLARTARRLVLLAYDDEPETGQHRTSLDISQDALASMLGMTRQSVASQLRQLSERGAIEQAYGRVNIRSMVALMAESS
jgi:CRP-like cAMP-binding protein